VFEAPTSTGLLLPGTAVLTVILPVAATLAL
jgi:hypothetical protein